MCKSKASSETYTSSDFAGHLSIIRRLLLDMHMMMKRLLRAVEAIPLHLSLAIVRLDDGLGESWALPYQACRTINVCMDSTC